MRYLKRSEPPLQASDSSVKFSRPTSTATVPVQVVVRACLLQCPVGTSTAHVRVGAEGSARASK